LNLRPLPPESGARRTRFRGDDLGRIEHPICTGDSGIVLKGLGDQRIGLMQLFNHVASLGARENLGPTSTRWIIAGASACPLRCFNLAINIRPVSPRRPSI
jgi:hypothetical protein